ncbi:MAG: efflux RND transporter periplasmic adaptor subunit [Pseudomonadota bacterium]
MGITLASLRSAVGMAVIFLWCGVSLAGSTFEGIVKPIHEVELAFPLDGVIARIFVKEGAWITQGDKLIQLDDSLQKLEVARREAIYLDRAEIEANGKNLLILQGLLDSSRKLYERSGAVSRDEVHNLEMQVYTLAGKIAVAEARKKQEQIEFEIAREVLARYTLRSPITGVITAIKDEEGEWAKGGQTIVTAADTSVCYAEFNVEEKFARALRVDEDISLQVREGNLLVQKTGRVAYVAPVADKASALVRVKVNFENRGGKTIPGVLAQIVFR